MFLVITFLAVFTLKFDNYFFYSKNCCRNKEQHLAFLRYEDILKNAIFFLLRPGFTGYCWWVTSASCPPLSSFLLAYQSPRQAAPSLPPQPAVPHSPLPWRQVSGAPPSPVSPPLCPALWHPPVAPICNIHLGAFSVKPSWLGSGSWIFSLL